MITQLDLVLKKQQVLLTLWLEEEHLGLALFHNGREMALWACRRECRDQVFRAYLWFSFAWLTSV